MDVGSEEVLLSLSALNRELKPASSDPPTQAAYQTATNIIKLAYELTTTSPPHVAHPSTIERRSATRCADSVRKVGQYYRATRQLVAAATTMHGRAIFHRVQVCGFQIKVPPSIQANSTSGCHTASDQAACAAAGNQNRLQRFHSSEAAVDTIITKRLNESRRGIKVHAEIQLLFFYECHEAIDPPRLIAASKASCYLCNLFFKLHGKFQVPSTFGKLNERWILPDWLPDFDAQQQRRFRLLVEQFDDVLNSLIKAVRETKKKRMPDPIESLIALSAGWSDLSPTISTRGFNQPVTTSTEPNAVVKRPTRARKKSKIHLGETELPYTMLITPEVSQVAVTVNRLTLMFDFACSSSGDLCLSHNPEASYSGTTFDAMALPTASEVQVKHCLGPYKTRFRIRHGCTIVDVQLSLGIL
jgi:hypothetical protein